MTKEQIQKYTLKTTQANQSGLVVILFEIDLVYINDAIKSYSTNDEQAFISNIELARKVHHELMGAMNINDISARRVLSILRFIYGQLVKSSIKKVPCDLEQCVEMLEALMKIFEKIHNEDMEEPVMKNTHRLYAGLTYGRGTLNESYGGADYSNRGFRA